MTCASCVARIERALKGLSGITDASVNLGNETARIVSAEEIDVPAAIATIRESGYEPVLQTHTVTIGGMTCAACVGRVERAIAALDGVVETSVNLATERATVIALPGSDIVDRIRSAVEKAGYSVVDTDGSESSIVTQQDRKEHDYIALKRRLAVAAIFTLPVFLISMGWIPGVSEWPFQQTAFLLLVLTLPVQFWAGWQFYVGTWRTLRHGSADMNTLIATGTSAAFLYSLVLTVWPTAFTATGVSKAVYFETSAVIITLVLFGRMLEARAKHRTSAAVRALMQLRPAEARIERDGTVVSVPPEQVLPGDIVVIRPGERIPVDGVVVDGRSTVDESLVTGESMPVDKIADDEVIGGSLNRSGSFRFRATRVGQDTMLAHIIQLVEDAQGSKAPVQRLVDRISAVFVPIVIAIAALTFVVWWAFGPQPAFTFAVLNAVAVLIVTCPCALGLATPTAIMVGTGRGAELGVLIKGGESLERARNLDTVVFDKTGTLTVGKPTVVGIRPADTWTDARLLEFAASAEIRSEHPLGDAIVRAARDRSIDLFEPEEFEAIPGHGLQAKVNGLTITIGNATQMANLGIDISLLARDAESYENDGATVTYVSVDNEFAGFIAIADTLKPNAAEAVRDLRNQGLRVVMLTGDTERTAQAIARGAGIDDTIAQVRPDEKAAVIEQLQREGRVIAMVGDGINDAPALAQADLGIAMGTGTDVAMETADVTLIRGDIRGVLRAIELSRATLRTIKQNLFWAFIYNVIGIPVAAGVLYPINGMLLDPMVASAAMALSSVSVVTNSLRLRRWNG